MLASKTNLHLYTQGRINSTKSLAPPTKILLPNILQASKSYSINKQQLRATFNNLMHHIIEMRAVQYKGKDLKRKHQAMPDSPSNFQIKQSSLQQKLMNFKDKPQELYRIKISCFMSNYTSKKHVQQEPFPINL